MSEDGQITYWWLVRHAPVIPDLGRMNGKTDVDCDVADKDAFRALARTLPRNAVWAVSPLSRTGKTAQAIIEAGAIAPRPIIETGLTEQDFGEWEGRAWVDLLSDSDSSHEAFWANPGHNAPPGGESFADQVARVGMSIDRLSAAHPGRDIIAVVHAGTIRAALAWALKLDPTQALAFKVDNLSLTRAEYIPGGTFRNPDANWRVCAVNLPPLTPPLKKA